MRWKIGKDAALNIRYDFTFERDIKRIKKRNKSLQPLIKVIRQLADRKSLSGTYKDHELKREWEGFRECHIDADWLLIYRIEDKTLYLERSGTHAELFGDS